MRSAVVAFRLCRTCRATTRGQFVGCGRCQWRRVGGCDRGRQWHRRGAKAWPMSFSASRMRRRCRWELKLLRTVTRPASGNPFCQLDACQTFILTRFFRHPIWISAVLTMPPTLEPDLAELLGLPDARSYPVGWTRRPRGLLASMARGAIWLRRSRFAN